VERRTVSEFNESNYLLRIRSSFLVLILGRRFLSYDIETIPPRTGTRFSFSWSTGILRREPSGPALLQVNSSVGTGPLARTYDVLDPVTGARRAAFVPREAGWEIHDARGGRIADVTLTEERFELARFQILVGANNIARLTWSLGATAASSEVEIEFLSASDDVFDRTFAIALAPIVEHKTRRSRKP
jgi:hypothetical protein